MVSLVWLAGCHAEEPPRPVPSIALDAHLPSGYRIAAVTSVVDGTLVRKNDAALESLFDGPIDGDHEIQTAIAIDVPCGLAAEPHARIVVRADRAFSGHRTSRVVLDLYGRDELKSLDERVAAKWIGRGVEWRPHGRYRWHERCLALAPRERSLCRARADIDEARFERDVVRANCASAILQQLQALPDISEAEAVELGARADACIGFSGVLETWATVIERCPDMP